MNQTETARTARFQHRLYVVLPLFLALAWAGVSGHSSASLLDKTSVTQSGSLTLIDHDRIALEGGTVTVSGAVVHVEQSSLIAGKSLISVQSDGYTLEGWNGVFETDASGLDKLTIAALTTPVLVERDADRWIVPVGMQMTIGAQPASSPESIADWIKTRRPLELPANYLRERLPDADHLMSLVSMHALSTDHTIIPPLAGNSLRFAVAQQSAEKQDASQRLADLSAALDSGDTAAFDTLINDPQTTAALNHTDRTTLLTILSLALGVKRDVPILLSLESRNDTTALLRFHPLLRDHVSLSSDAASDAQILLLSQVLLPLSDRGENPVSPLAVQAWQSGWQMLAASGALTSEVMDAVVPAVSSDITALDTAGYPERARAYSAALVTGIGKLPTSVSPDVQASLDHLRSIYDVAAQIADSETVAAPIVPVQVPPPPAAVSTSSVPVTVMPENDVRTMLIAQGCMFTAQSALRHKDNGAYFVDSVVIGTPAGDKIISFTLDPAKNTVFDIEKDGQILPYSLPFQKYLEWVKGL